MSIHLWKPLVQARVGFAITALIVTACAGSNDSMEQLAQTPATTATPIATTQTPSSLSDNTSSSALSVSTTSSTTPATATPQTSTGGNAVARVPTTTRTRSTTPATTAPRTSVVDNGVVDLAGVVRSAPDDVENCGSMQTYTFTMWVRYDNGETARYPYTVVPNPNAVPITGWRFDPYGLPLAHRMVNMFDPELAYMRCIFD
jgi:hypothetical protein